MRKRLFLLNMVLGWNLLWLDAAWAGAGEGKILKVLPHFLDKQGRHTLSPSLFERDAYQAYLRKHPKACSTMRFDIHWRGQSAVDSKASLKLRIQVRGESTAAATPMLIEQSVPGAGWWGHWTPLTLNREDYEKLGRVVAWKVTLWDGEKEIARQQSFLW